MASLRTGRKTVPIHPVRVRHVAPTASPHRRPPEPTGPDALARAFAELRRAAYDGQPVAHLEARIDRLLK
jgi:hypothetical protein